MQSALGLLVLWLGLAVGVRPSIGVRPLGSAYGGELDTHASSDLNGSSASIVRSVEELPGKELPDVLMKAEPESASWLNTLMDGLWPNINTAMQKTINEKVLPEIQKQMPMPIAGPLALHSLDRINVNPMPPVVGPVTTYKAKDGSFLKLQIGIHIQASVAIKFGFRVFKKNVGFDEKEFILEGFSLKGKLVVRFDQLLNELPVVGGIGVHFLDAPEIDYKLAGDFEWLDGRWLPPLHRFIRGLVDKEIAKLAVMPNQIAIPLGNESQVDMVRLKDPPKLGQLHGCLTNARDLQDVDPVILTGHSDPYVVVKIGAQTWTSSSKSNTGNPNWSGECHRFNVWDREQQVQVHLWDSDVNLDDYLGNVQGLDVAGALPNSDVPLKLSKKDGSKGQGTVTFNFQWVSASLPTVDSRLELDADPP